jgi:hypothetical protein
MEMIEMSILEERDEKEIWVNFEVKGMNLQTFKEFKALSREYNGSYPITIKVLLDKAKVADQLITTDSMKIELI